MKCWLRVFVLIGNDWIPGDRFDGWGSRSYDGRVECELRRQFAEAETVAHPLDFDAQWVCNRGQPATRPPPPSLQVSRERSFVQSPANPQTAEVTPDIPSALHPGLRLFTHEFQPWIREDAIGLRFTGPLTAPLAENLSDLFLRDPPVFNHIVLELDSPGGELAYVQTIVGTLKNIKKRASLVTRVMGAQVCASGCVAVYMQGTQRKASGASVWVFHGACHAGSTIPSPPHTDEFLALLESSGVSADFLCSLRDAGVMDNPGNFFISGHELFHNTGSGIIQELLPPWQPEDPVLPRPYQPR